jgi:acetyltransferase (GNAT) family
MDKKEDIKVLKSGYELRTVRSGEADQAAHIEEACFPPNEACSAEQIKKRVATASELFLVAVDMSTGKLAGFLNGLATDEESFRDEFFKDAGMNDPKGKNIMLLGLDVLAEHRGKGLATDIMNTYVEKERKNGRKKLILTCLDHLVEMYKKMGYTDLGEANSTWGGEKWHEMIYILNE